MNYRDRMNLDRHITGNYGEDFFDDDDADESQDFPLDVFDGNYLLAAYEVDQCYGGPEEGGWWYNTGRLVRVIGVFHSREAASEACRRANGLIRVLQRRRRALTSVLYSGGRFEFAVYRDCDLPKAYPETRPHYE